MKDTLSNKVVYRRNPNNQEDDRMMYEKDVKEFIKELKKKLYEDPEACCHGVRETDFDRIVKELAGEKLI